jgi:hypothetical protein
LGRVVKRVHHSDLHTDVNWHIRFLFRTES